MDNIPIVPEAANPRRELPLISTQFSFEKILTGIKHAPVFSNENCVDLNNLSQRSLRIFKYDGYTDKQDFVKNFSKIPEHIPLVLEVTGVITRHFAQHKSF